MRPTSVLTTRSRPIWHLVAPKRESTPCCFRPNQARSWGALPTATVSTPCLLGTAPKGVRRRIHLRIQAATSRSSDARRRSTAIVRVRLSMRLLLA